MQVTKILRMTMVFGLILALTMLLAACGGGGAAAPTASSQGAASDPTAAAKGFVEAVFTGGDVTPYVCQAAGSDELKAGLEGITAAFQQANATIDVTGLTYTASNQTDTSAEVTVAGTLKVTVSGVEQELPMADSNMVLPMKKEGDTWQVCAFKLASELK